MTERFRIFGKVFEKESERGIPNLIVEALDKDLFYDDRLGSVLTDKDGKFEIHYDRDDFQDLFFDQKPDIYIRVRKKDGELIYTSEDSVRYSAGKTEAFYISIPASMIGEDVMNKNTYNLKGQIDLSEIPESLTLRVYAIRDSEVIGTALPDRDGHFEVEFTHPSETRVGVKLAIAPDVPESYYHNIASDNAVLATMEHTISALAWQESEDPEPIYGLHMPKLIVSPAILQNWLTWTQPFHVNGRVCCKNTGKPVPYAIVDAFQVCSLTSGGYSQHLVGSSVSQNCGNFYITFPWYLILLWLGERPDLIFRVSQNINNSVKVIYNEDPSKTRWDMTNYSFVQLLVENDCLSINNPDKSQPGDSSFLFTRVGLIGVNNINANGYADASPLTPSGYTPGDFKDAPFGRTLHLCGWFGEASDVTHYKIQYGKNGANFQDIVDPLSNEYYDFVSQTWVTVPMGPFELGGMKNVFTTPYLVDKANGLSWPRPWYFPDLLAAWDSTRTTDGDGQYSIQITGYKWDGTNLSPAASLTIDPNYGKIQLQIDNAPPESQILDIYHSPSGSPLVKPCDIVEFKTGDTLTVYFKAFDSNGHLGGYGFDALYGHNCYVSPKPQGAYDGYSSNTSQAPDWKGNNYSISYKADDYGVQNGGTCIPGSMPTCAYELRLHVWKRTTNGYGVIYDWVEDTKHITIKRP